MVAKEQEKTYKCLDCGKQVKYDYVRKKIRCPYCGSKILYKERSFKTTVIAR
ncbi:MAG: DNA-directed RNA polymerase subunit P [Candidatus Nanoarchaeia archaeon]|nr:DNA-directed RNA polymerase subunit P [Candidatus Nanoarchaeia archaeon]